MLAAGGDPEVMTVGQFLDLGYAALVEEYIRTGSTLMEALDKTKEYAAGSGGVVTAGVSATRREPQAEPGVAPPPSAETFLTLAGAMKNVGGFNR